ncbi:MAG: molecular chaperone TorD family protein [Arcobacter sp.]|nr:molecular chaperone TorD family protein [Arcobacter sp.]
MKDNNIYKSRALYYAMFSRFFVFATDNSRYLELINLIDTLQKNPLDKTTSVAFTQIRKELKSDSNISFMKEFDSIFHSPETSMVRTTASYFDENVESGKKRLEMQNFLAKTKIRRDEKQYSDYEDHVGFIFSVMSELCDLISEDQEEYINTSHCIFDQILNEFIDDFAKEVYEHEEAKIFKNIVVLLKTFIEFERIFLEVSIPNKKENKNLSHEDKSCENISEDEAARRARNKALRAKGPKKEQEQAFVTFDVDSTE